MSDRAKDFMAKVWEQRNDNADTEEKLVSVILKIASESVIFYTAQNGTIVLDKNDLIQLSNEIQDLNQ